MADITGVTKQSGIGLLEVMLALVISALVLMMSVRYYQTTSTDQKVSSSVNMVRDMYSALQSVAKQRDFQLGSGDSIPELISDGLLTQQYNKNPFNGTNTTNTTTAGSVPIAVITMNNVPDKACDRIAGRLVQTMSNPNTSSCGGGDVECVGCSSNSLTVHYGLY